MRALRDCPPSTLRRLHGVLTDIDDTLTTDGRLPAQSYAAMERLEASGLTIVPITGRPAGWCDHIARMWPVQGVVGENGAFWFRYDRGERRMLRHFVDSAETRREQATRLQGIATEILHAIPGARIASDQRYRESDLAIDFCEDVPRLPERDVERIVMLMQARGLTVKVSSIHVNGWFGSFDKLSTTLKFLTAQFGTDAEAVRKNYAFIGDSPNDEPMFGYFDCSVGVANVRDFAHMRRLPHYVTQGRAGNGFAEFVDCLIRARRGPT
ncbi:MAG: HAD-IIB family hydrolase [Burkholderiales bacterium]|nr:HAD-IIB family hydrolase [Burkholderiales bacterium]